MASPYTVCIYAYYPEKILDLLMIDCCILLRAFRGLSGLELLTDMRSTQALTAACVNMSAAIFLMQNSTNIINRTDYRASEYTSVSDSYIWFLVITLFIKFSAVQSIIAHLGHWCHTWVAPHIHPLSRWRSDP